MKRTALFLSFTAAAMLPQIIIPRMEGLAARHYSNAMVKQEITQTREQLDQCRAAALHLSHLVDEKTGQYIVPASTIAEANREIRAACLKSDGFDSPSL